MSPKLRQMYEQHAIDEHTIELLQEANANLRKALEMAEPWVEAYVAQMRSYEISNAAAKDLAQIRALAA